MSVNQQGYAKFSDKALFGDRTAEKKSAVTEEVNRSISAINGISNQTATGAEQSRIAASSLQELSDEMKSKIQKYTV
ncbi:hypothetical protein RN22_05790 [Grimontia sp. AD028]|nr:hypothetical protein RN22_05790 [Grimontia sp. AD028]